MSTGARLGILAAIIVAAVVALVIASGGSDNNSTTTTSAATATQATGTGTATTTSTSTTATQSEPAGPKTFTVIVKNAKPAGGIEKIKVNKGDEVRIVVNSDTTDEVHLHGYDIHKDVKAGGSATFNFKATIDGGFVMELESRGEQIAELTVEP
jgi:maltose-binding protein MalE